MIIHPNESPSNFKRIPGEVVLIDPNGHQIAQVSESKVTRYLAANRLSAFPDHDQASFAQMQMLRVFPLSLQPIFEKLDSIPTVQLPVFSVAFGFVELRSYSDFYSQQSIQTIIVEGLNKALETAPVVCYRAGSEEAEILGIGIGWRTWFLEDVLKDVLDSEIVAPPGLYPSLKGAIIRNRKGPPLNTVLEKLPG